MACLGSFLVIPKHYSNITEVYLNLFKDTLKGVRSKDKKKFASRRKSPNPNGPGSCLGYILYIIVHLLSQRHLKFFI